MTVSEWQVHSAIWMNPINKCTTETTNNTQSMSSCYEFQNQQNQKSKQWLLWNGDLEGDIKELLLETDSVKFFAHGGCMSPYFEIIYQYIYVSCTFLFINIAIIRLKEYSVEKVFRRNINTISALVCEFN